MNKQQGIAWAPLLIIVTVIAVAGVLGYVIIQGNDSVDSDSTNVTTVNSAVNENTNTVKSESTNVIANVNTVVNTNSAANVNSAANTNSDVNTNTAPDPTTGWETYESTELGFSLSLLDGWYVDEVRSSENEIVFTDGLASEVREAVRSENTALSIEEYAQTLPGYGSMSDIVFQGLPAKRVIQDGIGNGYIVVQKDDRMFALTVGRMESNGMLDTFQFID